jgi:hypothetical protein
LADRNIGIVACSSSEVINKTFDPESIPYIAPVKKIIYSKKLYFEMNLSFIGKPRITSKKR